MVQTPGYNVNADIFAGAIFASVLSLMRTDKTR